MTLNKLIIGCMLLTLLTPCWAADMPNDVKPTAQAQGASTLTSSTKPIVVSAASPTFAIRLTANAGTGYQWFLVDYNSRLVKLLSQQYVSGQTKLVGASGISVWEFQAQQIAFIAPQVTTITLEYRRAWEPKAVKQQTFTIVTGAGK